jgi:AcrR family transcriptional regulator
MLSTASAPSRRTTRNDIRTPSADGRGVASSVGRVQVSELQRARLLTAMVQEVAQRGAANVNVGHVVGRSGVSRRTFYELFEDRQECYLAAFDEAVGHLAEIVIPAYRQPGSWRARIRSALIALLECLDEDRAAGRLLIVESLTAGPRALQRRQHLLAQITPVIQEGSTEAKTAVDPSALIAEGVIGGVLSILHARLAENPKDTNTLLDLTGPLMGMIVLPYLGVSAARKEIHTPPPKHAAKQRLVRTDPLQGLPMRLTYRTMRVLTAVAELAGPESFPSNRAVGEHAGIGDQGQASKLLARLHKLGLIENHGGDPARGEANAWTLTHTGTQIHNSIANLEKQTP